MRKFLILIAVFLLTACAVGEASPLEWAPIEIEDVWMMRITVEGKSAHVQNQRRLSLTGQQIGDLMHGAPLLEADVLEAYYLDQGAEQAACTVGEELPAIIVDCQVEQTLAVKEGMLAVRLPDRALLQPVRLLSAETGRAVSLSQVGRIETELPAAELVTGAAYTRDDSGSYHRRLRREFLSKTVHFEGQEYLPAGMVVVPPEEENILRLWLAYHPPQTRYWLLGGALFVTLFAVTLAFPVRAHVFSTNQQEAAAAAHLPSFIQHLITLLLALRSQLRENGVQLVTHVLGLMLAAVGLILFILAWILAPIESILPARREELAGWLARLPLPVVWPALEVSIVPAALLLLFGLLLMLLGLGLWLRQEWARLLILSLLLALFLAVIILWPALLLYPPLIPGQAGILWLCGALAMLCLSLTIYTLRHPKTRRAFLNGGGM